MTSSPQRLGRYRLLGFLNASGNAVSVICHSRHRDSHVSIRKERKTLQQAVVSKQFGFE